MHRIEDWRFRNKVLLVALLPLVVVTLLLIIAFSFGLRSVWDEAVPHQADLLHLDALVREYQSEIREFALLGAEETREEIEEIEVEIPPILERLRRIEDPEKASRVSSFLEPGVSTMVQAGHAVVRSVASGEAAALGAIPESLEAQLDVFEDRESNLEDRIEEELTLAQQELAGAIAGFGWWVMICASVGLGVGLLSSLWLAGWLQGPLEVLRQASERILDGNYRAGEKIRSREELGQLATGFDRAAEAIRGLLAEKEESLATLKDNQAQLVRSGKLAAVGELAAGVAHEINNPLSAVLTYSVLLREKAEASPPEATEHLPKLTRRLQIIEEAARRCKDIADKLLTFSRQDEAKMRPVSLTTVVEDSFELMKLVLRRKGVQVERRLEKGLPAIMGNPSQLQQVVFNLINNAIHASHDGGRLEVAVRRAGDGCELQVTDEGMGMEPEVVDRIFEPFYTTKPPGQGTGLGLAIVYGIVEAHGGDIDVETEPGSGTTFSVRLPVAEMGTTGD